MGEPKVCIVILNFNGWKDTIECLESLKNLDYENYHVLVVDNYSTDDSIIHISKYINNIPNFRLIKNKINNGFSAGNNIGIRWALQEKFDYICLLNNDTIVTKEFLNPLVNYMEEHISVGISAGKIMYYNNPTTIWSAGGYIDYKKLLGCHFGIDNADCEKFNEIRDVDFLTGCLQLIRSSVFEHIGLYDEDYFLYMEDVDFCIRCKQENIGLVYIPESKIYHKVSASTGGIQSPTVIYYSTRNRFIFKKKNLPDMKYTVCLVSLFGIKTLIQPFRDINTYPYYIKGMVDYFKGIKGKVSL